MNPLVFAMRSPFKTIMLVVALVSGGVLGLAKVRPDVLPALNTPRVSGYLDYIGDKAKQMKGYIVDKYESFFHKHEEEHHEENRKVVVTSPKVMDVIITQPYVCQIHSKQHIEVRALDSGYLQEISIKEGQAVKKDQSMFKILPVLYEAKLAAEKAKALLAKRELDNTTFLSKQTVAVVSQNEVLLYTARLAEADAKVQLAEAELKFANVTAPFDGIVDRQRQQLGSYIQEGDILTTLSDNSKMWVYFNVPEKQYLEYMAHRKQHEEEDRIELVLANQEKFPYPGNIGNGAGAIEGQFNNENGNIAFRADFPNPDGLLRHGQTGTILIHRTLKNALVIPQRATFELLDKRYVKVVGEDGVADQRLITIKHELDDIFVIDSAFDVSEKRGIAVSDKIVLEGVREVEVGSKVEYEFRQPEEALKNQKFHAE
jgi:membrane fusion protein, multidrug efflux system